MARSAVSQRGTWFFTGAAILLTVVGLFWPVMDYLALPEAEAAPEVVTITDYKASFTVDEDGSLDVVERITGDFPPGRHGIFRYWDVVDPSDSHVRLWPEDIKVLRDGEPERYRAVLGARPPLPGSEDRQGRTYLDAGTHVYTISYRIDGALAPATAGLADRQLVGGRGHRLGVLLEPHPRRLGHADRPVRADRRAARGSRRGHRAGPAGRLAARRTSARWPRQDESLTVPRSDPAADAGDRTRRPRRSSSRTG